VELLSELNVPGLSIPVPPDEASSAIRLFSWASISQVTQTLFRSCTPKEGRNGRHVSSGRRKGAGVGMAPGVNVTKIMTVIPCTRLRHKRQAAGKGGFSYTITYGLFGSYNKMIESNRQSTIHTKVERV
jgi:hypothetical protein